MLRRIAAAGLLAATTIVPLWPAAAQDPFAGGLIGGVLGGAVGGAVGGGRGAAIGAIVGATTGAAIAAEGRRYGPGYYGWHGGCYLERADGAWIRVSPRYCY